MFNVNGLRAVLTTSRHDSANETAFWASYAGMIKAHRKVCAEPGHRSIACAYIPSQANYSAQGYGFSLCDGATGNSEPSIEPEGAPINVGEWRNQETKPVLYVDATALMNCRAAFTGGGSHSDIYRRETARFIWELIR